MVLICVQYVETGLQESIMEQAVVMDVKVSLEEVLERIIHTRAGENLIPMFIMFQIHLLELSFESQFAFISTHFQKEFL